MWCLKNTKFAICFSLSLHSHVSVQLKALLVFPVPSSAGILKDGSRLGRRAEL